MKDLFWKTEHPPASATAWLPPPHMPFNSGPELEGGWGRITDAASLWTKPSPDNTRWEGAPLAQAGSSLRLT